MIQIQKDSKLDNLAYLTAATYGFDNEAAKIKDTATTNGVELAEPDPHAQFLRPPPPVQQAENNWPLLTVSRVCILFFYLK